VKTEPAGALQETAYKPGALAAPARKRIISQLPVPDTFGRAVFEMYHFVPN
jgi:hypothetical protein